MPDSAQKSPESRDGACARLCHAWACGSIGERSNPERLPNGRGDCTCSQRLDRSTNGCLDDEICHSDPNHTNAAATSGAGAEYAALKKRFLPGLRKRPYPPDRSSRPLLRIWPLERDPGRGMAVTMMPLRGRYDHREAYRQVQICGIYRVPRPWCKGPPVTSRRIEGKLQSFVQYYKTPMLDLLSKKRTAG